MKVAMLRYGGILVAALSGYFLGHLGKDFIGTLAGTFVFGILVVGQLNFWTPFDLKSLLLNCASTMVGIGFYFYTQSVNYMELVLNR